jgi:hypothetical protein
MLHMLRTGTPYPLSGGGVASGGSHRAAAARGPTSAERLQEAKAGCTTECGGGGAVPRGPDGCGADTAVAGAAEAAAAAAAASEAAEAELRAADAAGDAAAWARLLALCRVRLAAGDASRLLGGRGGLEGAYAAVTLGHMHAHLTPGLAHALAPRAPLLVEASRGMVLLTDAQAAAFEARVAEAAARGGLAAAGGGRAGAVARAAWHAAFVRAAAAP